MQDTLFKQSHRIRITLTLAVIIFWANFSDGQISVASPQGVTLTTEELTEAKALFITLMESDDYKRHEAVSKEFAAKLPRDFSFEHIHSELEFEKAISERLSDSKFTSVKEATDMSQKLVDTQLRLEKNNGRFYELIQRATAAQGKEIYKPLFDRERVRLGM